MAIGKAEKNLWAVLGGAVAVVAGSVLLLITILYCWMALMF